MNQEIISREALYELVWSRSLLSLSKQFDLSDNGFRKLCTRMAIPLPKNGHWQQAKFGKQGKQPPLPYPYNGDSEVRLALREPGKPNHRVQDKVSVLPDRLNHPHPLVIRARAVLEKAEPDRYRYLHLLSCNFEALDIKVTKANIGRAVRFMDHLIKALEKAGHELQLNNRKTYVNLGGSNFQIFLREKTRRVEDPPGGIGTTQYLPTGILSFSVGIGLFREFHDGRLTLEEQLPAILEHVEVLHQERLALRQSQRMKAAAEKEKQGLLQEAEDRHNKEVADFNALLEKAERWEKVGILRRYIDEVERRATLSGTISEDMKGWLEWAREKGDGWDPFGGEGG